MINTLILDNDGVLVDTEKLYYKSCKETLKLKNIHLSTEEFIKISLIRGESVFQGHDFTVQEFNELREIRNKIYSELLKKEVSVFPEVKDTLASIRNKIRIVVVTSSLKEHFDLIHRHSGLRTYFDHILTREAFVKTKPHPEPYLTAINKFSLIPEKSIVIEDSPRGIESAKAAGLKTYQYTGNKIFAETKTLADGKLDNFSEIKNILELN